MAKFLSWAYLSRDHVLALRAAGGGNCKAGQPSARELLRRFLEAPSHQQQDEVQPEEPQAPQQQQQQEENAAAEEDCLQRQEIVLDLYCYALKQGQAWGFDDERLSVLLGLVKEVHAASVSQRLTIERSFALFKDGLLNHSVHRPPFSCGVFSQPEMEAVLEWALTTYYRHYKLYQYAFTKRVTLSVSTYHPSSLVELPPASLAPLAEALTEQQHQQELDEQQWQEEEARQRAAEAAAAAAEEAAARAVQLEYEESLPDDVKAKVAAALEREVAYLKRRMEEQFQAQQAALIAKLARLEAAAAAAAAPPAVAQPPAGTAGSKAAVAGRPPSGATVGA